MQREAGAATSGVRLAMGMGYGDGWTLEDVIATYLEQAPRLGRWLEALGHSDDAEIATRAAVRG